MIRPGTLLFFCSLLSAQAAFAQSSQERHRRNADSVERLLLQHPQEDTQRVILLNLHAYNLLELDLRQSRSKAEAALALAEKIKYKAGEAEAYLNLGGAAFRAKNFPENISFYQEGVAGFAAAGRYEKLEEVRSALLNTFFYIGDYPRAMKESLDGLNLAQQRKDRRRIASYTNLLGFICYKQGDNKQAKTHFQNYLSLAEAAGDQQQIANACSNLSDVYNEEKNYEASLALLSRALEIYKTLKRPPSVSLMHYQLGHTLLLKGDYAEALRYTEQAIAPEELAPPNLYDLARYHIGKGEILLRMNEAEKAIAALREGLGISRSIRHRENMKDAYNNLASAFAALNRFDSAYYYQTQFSALKDSLLSESSIKEVADMQAQHAVAQKDKEIALIEAENNKRGQARNFLIGIGVLVAGIFFLLYNKYRLDQKHKLQQTINEQQNELFNSVVTTQENERKRIAEDLHDGLGSLLSTAKLNLERMEEERLELSAEQQRQYRAALELLDNALSELRNVSHHLMPATLSKLGLAAALQNLFDKLSAFNGIRVNFVAHDCEPRFKEETEVSIYHIILELMNNVVKHAGAKEVTVQLVRFPAHVNITVEDDGGGFDPQQAKAKKGLGLNNIISRVRYLAGTIEIDSAPGKGATIMIDIPLA